MLIIFLGIRLQMLLRIKTNILRLIGAYNKYVGKRQWLHFLGLYAFGVIATLLLWSVAKLLVLLLVKIFAWL